MKKLIVIPAYNEGECILDVVSGIRHTCPDYDYIVINDCSKDNTLSLLKKNHIPFINLTVNLGIGGAVQAGYRYAYENDYDIAIQLDGDGQHDCRYLDIICEPIEKGIADICIGSRFVDKNGFQSSRSRRAGIHILSFLIFCCTGQKIKDVTSGFRAVNKKMIKYYADDYPQDYPEPEAIAIAARGARLQEIPVVMKERIAGTSSIRKFKSLYYMIKVSLAIIIETARGKERIDDYT